MLELQMEQQSRELELRQNETEIQRQKSATKQNKDIDLPLYHIDKATFINRNLYLLVNIKKLVETKDCFENANESDVVVDLRNTNNFRIFFISDSVSCVVINVS